MLGDRLAQRLTARLRQRACPNHWSFLFGVVTVACLAVLTLTGVVLMYFYDPAATTVRYQGSYPPLRGVEMSRALESTLRISFEARAGLLVRQTHHWAALLLPASVIMQLLTTFFTGAFRRPRQWAWVLLFGVFVLALVGGWSGYALPDDSLSGTGLRIVQGVVLGLPLVGTWLSTVIFGGEFPGQVLRHLYLLHVVVVPPLLVLLLVLRRRLANRDGPPQLPGPGRTEGNVVGLPLWPAGAVRAGGLFFLTAGVLVTMAGTLTVAPVWLYGPASGGNASAGSQPDWYTGFLDGALRLVPSGWEVVWLGRTWTFAVLVPLAVVSVFLALVLLYPFLEARVTGDRRVHHLLDRPRDAPGRTAVGVAGLTFYGTLWAAGSADLAATQFWVGVEDVVRVLRVSVVVAPVVAFLITRRACLTLQGVERERTEQGAE
jgi:ubiquinol-cytochrome c reductase cytochrome b subunit